MSALAYALCQKPVVGIMMFAASLCAFPPLLHDAPLPLQQAGATLVREIDAPVAKPYFLDIDFAFPSAASLRADQVVGTRYDETCLRNAPDLRETQSAGLGRSIPLHVLVRDQRSGAVAIDKVFNSLCLTASGGSGFHKVRKAARLDLAAGHYVIEVRNLASQPGLDGVRTTVSLVAGHGK